MGDACRLTGLSVFPPFEPRNCKTARRVRSSTVGIRPPKLPPQKMSSVCSWAIRTASPRGIWRGHRVLTAGRKSNVRTTTASPRKLNRATAIQTDECPIMTATHRSGPKPTVAQAAIRMAARTLPRRPPAIACQNGRISVGLLPRYRPHRAPHRRHSIHLVRTYAKDIIAPVLATLHLTYSATRARFPS